MLFVRRWPAGYQWLLTFQTKRVLNIVDSALYEPPVTVPQLPRILHLLHCWQFLPSTQSVASIQHFSRTWAGAWVCSPHRMHLKCR